MHEPNFSLEQLVAELRRKSADDIEFAQRVAKVCCRLFEQKSYSADAIRRMFRI